MTTTPPNTKSRRLSANFLVSEKEEAKAASAEDDLVFDIVETMCRQESSTYKRLRSSYFSDENHNVWDSWRCMLIEWMYQVVDFSYVQRETLGVAVYLFDICIDEVMQDRTCKTSYQLAAATSLQLAVKTHDSKIIKHKDLTILGRGAFTEQDVADMEWKIIQACNWHLHPPSNYCFLNEYMKLLHVSNKIKAKIYHVAMIITESTLSETKYKAYPPSIVAYATIILAMACIDTPSVTARSQRFFCDALSSRILHESSSSLLLIQILHDIQESMQTKPDLDCLGLLNSTTLQLLTRETVKGTSDDVYKTTSPESPIAVTEARWRAIQ